ncbi:MAG TPA: tRNA 5-hydroxyuridine modification protein YegQ [Leptospiraceae bacterium]|nr:tRNA 5-hydroxyuridine modification protein YegQ [Leptospirales bacterium]HMU83972.1 tRNA 5-hydroxyuridine modification protein YegQ [Leptospiraceae bacterium]HMX55154.1 tRNA 5-hydroxyuridine modification protein YegQ [Leptospiraceae bacterium]HMY44097.1 tRNA 5-hydroxyuridine modification protein YegQ [Leptospiraceae bacterium]HNE21887.1 tRNA 5-hydroxyuridine modification protein YegQ [Leptospiraceae bacterium]
MKKPELLLPAGSLEKMRIAFDFGADAVYAGQPRYSLRARNNEFRMEELAIGISEAHARGKKFYVTSNIIAHNNKIKSFLKDMAEVAAMKPDAVIMADPGLIYLVRENWPELPIHLSVQASTTNYAAVKFWAKQGVERIILSRELSLKEVEEIKMQCPETEIEVFVHGALCIAYSGRCLLSGYFNKRDPNQGVCTNACRWEYTLHPAAIDDSPRHPLGEYEYLLTEATRPGEFMPIMEDEHGTYILNSRDLRAIQHVPDLMKMGVESLKIEGRTKSLYYVARVTRAYRKAIDDMAAGLPFDESLIEDLEHLANRGYTPGFFGGTIPGDAHNDGAAVSRSDKSRFCGMVASYDSNTKRGFIHVRNFMARGDEIEVLVPSGNHRFVISEMYDESGNPLEVAPGNGWKIHVPMDADLTGGFVVRIASEDSRVSGETDAWKSPVQRDLTAVSAS